MKSFPKKFVLLGSFFLFVVGISIPLFAQKKAIILDHKDRVRISPLHVLNSRYRETNLSITPDGHFLYFMTVRGQQPWSSQTMTYKDMPIYDGDIWFSEKTNGKWSPPKCLPPGINTSQGEDEPNVSPDGRIVYFQSWKNTWQIDGGPYYAASLKGSKWGQPIGLGGGINSFFAETGINATDGMAIAPDGKTFVVACGYDYSKAMDLYISHKVGAKWSYLKKLPASTKGNERSAFIAADGKTLYFASDGYNGFGGLDIYKTEINDDGTLGDIINVGAPFNTNKDDYGFILTGDGSEAYFIRDDDIYFADLSKADERIKPQIELILEGTIVDRGNKRGIAATVSVVDMKTQKVLYKERANNRGKYKFILPNEDKNYQVTVLANGYENADAQTVKAKKQVLAKTYTYDFKLEKTRPVEPKPANPEVAVVTPPKQPENPIVEPVTPPIVIPEPPKVDREMEWVNWAKQNPVRPISPKKPKPIPVKTPEEHIAYNSLLAGDPYSFEGFAENHLILLLDVSGSMNSRDKLPVLRSSLLELVDYMRKEDKITAISFAGKTSALLENASSKDKDLIKNRLQKLNRAGGGSTKARPALRRAYKLAKKHYIKGGNNRIILATDGGPEAEKLYSLANKLAKKNIYLTVFVFGKMSEAEKRTFEELANRAHGNLYNVNTENMDEVLLQEVKAIKK